MENAKGHKLLALIYEQENLLQQKDFKIQQLENQISAQTQQINSQAEEIKIIQNLNEKILNSNSWKFTKPLRIIGGIIKKL